MTKKKESLSSVERLKNALVPDWEQPYKVPTNWVWTRLGEPFDWGSGGTPSRKIPEYYTGTIPWVKTGELYDGYIYDTEEKITEEAIKKSSAKLFPVDTVVIAMYGATIGKVAILGKVATTNQACACAKPNGKIDVKYLFYYAISQKDNFIKKGKGGAQPNISQEIIKQHHFPLPPLAEQQRIVDRIESLFYKLDEAKEKLQAALDSFKNRKAAILHKAFTGELTRKWREENGADLNTRPIKPLSELCHSFQYGTSSKSNKLGKMAVVRMGNLQNGEIDWIDLAYSDNDEDNIKYALRTGDVLFNRTNSPALVGKTSIYRGEIPAIFAGYLIRINYAESLMGEYLNYMLNSTQAKEYCRFVKTDGVNQSNINAKKIAAFEIPVPPLREQAEIVRILDSIFTKEQEAKELVSVIEKIDLMKKAILARAFRGKLGTNDPNEESAKELLKEILEV